MWVVGLDVQMTTGMSRFPVHFHGHISVNRAKVTSQDRKGFNNEIKNIRHDLMLSEYPEEFVEFVMKPSRSNRPS
jgi:hypothetical protein